jgi:hypothetical protein
MLKNISVCIGCLILAISLPAYGFDCNNPELGAHIEVLNKDGYFAKYMEKNDISYYKYSGPCRVEKFGLFNPSIVYAFIENRLYARIVNIKSTDENHENNRKFMENEVYTISGITPYEIKLDGDWWIYQWPVTENKTKHKIKINSKTQEIKDVYYYEPLRTKLKSIVDTDDLAS